MDPIRVVLADDHTLFREGTRELLERDGGIVVVGEAGDGASAVELVDSLRPDVLVVDIEMPVLDGIEATRRVKLGHPGVGVLVLTIHDEDPFVLAIIEAGAAGYLLKDVHGEELVRAVHALRDGESVLHPAIVEKVLRQVRSMGADGGKPSSDGPIELSDQDRELLRRAACGQTNQEIADALGVSLRTVQLRMTGVFGRLGVGSRIEAVIAALRRGFLDLEELLP